MTEQQISILEVSERLERIEKGLISQKTVLNFTDFCTYVGISKSHGYKLTSTREVPHFCPNGKTLFFSKVEIDQWLLRNPIKTIATLKREVKGGAKSC